MDVRASEGATARFSLPAPRQDASRCVQFLNEAKLATDNAAKGVALAQVQELLLKRRPDLVPRFLQPVLELTADPASAMRQWVPTFLEAALQLNESLLSVAVLEAVVRLVQDKTSAVVKRAIGCSTYLYPLALRLIAKSTPTAAQVLSKALEGIRDAVLGVLSATPRPPVATQVQSFKFVEALVALPLAPVAQVLDPRVLQQLQQQSETYLQWLVDYVAAPGLEPPVHAALLATLGAVACAPGGVPLTIQKRCIKPLIDAAESESVAKPSRKAAQLALLRVLRAGIVTADRAVEVEEIEDAITVSGGGKQLEKLRRQQRRGREEVVYAWDEDEGLGAGGDVEALTAYQQLLTQQTPAMPLQPQPQVQLEPQQLFPVPADLTLLDARVLLDVEVLLRDLSAEQMADLILENMANLAAVGAKPGDEAFFELAAVARDPRLTEERKSRKAAPRIPVLGVCEGVAVPRLDRAQLQQMWRGCIDRVIDAEDAMLQKGPRAAHLRAALLARLVCGHHDGPTVEPGCRRALMHACDDLMRRWRVVLHWLTEEWRLSGYVESDAGGGDATNMVDGDDADAEQAADGAEAVAKKRKRDPEGSTGPAHNYVLILDYVLDAMVPSVETVVVALRSLLTTVPYVPRSALERLAALAGDPEKHACGLSLLASLARALPRYRDECVRKVMELTVADDLSVRKAAIAEAVSLYLLPECRTLVESSARDLFDLAVRSTALNHEPAATVAPLDEAQQAEQAAIPEERRALLAQVRQLEAEREAAQLRAALTQEIGRRIAVYFALCGENLSLLEHVGQVYGSVSAGFKREILEMVKITMGNAMGEPPVEPPALVDALAFVQHVDAHPLLLVAVQAVTGAVKAPSERLVELCRSRFRATRDAALLVPVLKELKPREVLDNMSRFLLLSNEGLTDFVARALATPYFAEKPADFMLGVFGVADEDYGGGSHELVRRQNEAVALCMAHPRITQDVMAVVLRRWSDVVPIHALFMKTLMLTVDKYGNLMGWALSTLLPKLVAASVWTQKLVWKAFQKFCMGTLAQGSCPHVLRLPDHVLKDWLAEDPALGPVLKKYVQTHAKSASTAVKRILRGEHQKK